MGLHIPLDGGEVRSFRVDDAEALARHANNREVWRNLRDAFPHPYGIEDARAFIAGALEADPENRFAIAVNGAAVGGIGFLLHTDVERLTAELGYWVAQPFWNRGLATAAVKAITAHAIETHGLLRVYALPYAWNVASSRVLEKAGYVCEGRLRKSAIKDGTVVDQLMYAYVVDDEDA